MTYPLIFNTEEEHILHVKENPDFYKKILLEDKKLIESLVNERYQKSSKQLEEEKQKLLKESETNKKQLEEEKQKLLKDKELFDNVKNEMIKLKEQQLATNELLDKLKQEKTKLLEQNLKQKEIINLSEKKVGDHSMYKGKFNEEFTHMCLEEYFSDNFKIEGKGEIHCMDKRMCHKTKNYTLGIECKSKTRIVTQDIDKFRKDKITNKFKGNIFISSCKISKIVELEDDFCLLNNDELYIFSKNKDIILTIIKLFISYIESDKDESKLMYLMGEFKQLYKQWINTKKSLLDFDKLFINILKNNGFEINIKGNTYLVPISKCKNSKYPY